MAHALTDIGLDDPDPMQLIATRLRRDRVVAGKRLHLGASVVGTEIVVRHQQLLLADQLPVETVHGAEEDVRLVDGVLVIQADLWRIVGVRRIRRTRRWPGK